MKLELVEIVGLAFAGDSLSRQRERRVGRSLRRRLN